MTSQEAKTQLVVKDRQSIMERARERKHGKWIERILVQCRRMLTGVGFKEFKDISEQIRNLPKLTGQASYPAWRLAVDKLIAANKDGRQLVHLEKVLAFIELCVPLGPLFDRLPRAEFDEATATPEQIVQQAMFEKEFLSWAAQDDAKDVPPLKLEAHPVREGLTDPAEDASGETPPPIFNIGEQVEVRLHPLTSRDGTPSGSGTAPRWVPAVVCQFDASKGDFRYICHIPDDYDGKPARRSQVFMADDVKKVAGYTYGIEQSPARSKDEAEQGNEGSVIQEFLNSQSDAIQNGYKPDEWPVGIMIWQLRQCTKLAIDLNTSLYEHVKNSITDKQLLESVHEEGNLIRLLLNLRKRFGSNAGVAHIQNAAENGVLKPFQKVEDIADKLHRWASYIKDTDPNVQIIAMALHHLDEFIGKQRDGPIKNDLLSVYTSKLEAFGRDPTNEAEEMLKRLQEELVKVGSTQQTHTAIRGKAEQEWNLGGASD